LEGESQVSVSKFLVCVSSLQCSLSEANVCWLC